MDDKKYRRLVQTSVTCFLYHGDDYLFLKRNLSKRIDPGRLNGIGGRVEPRENYLDAAIRETKEETGYQVSVDDIVSQHPRGQHSSGPADLVAFSPDV